MSISRILGLLSYARNGNSSRFWHGLHPFVCYDFSTLSDYYLDFSCRPRNRHCVLVDGVPHLAYSFATGVQYNPCAVAQWGLGCWQVVQRSRIAGLNAGSDQFLSFCQDGISKAVESLLSHFVYSSHECGFWYYSFDLPAYSQSAPWKSAIAQGQALSFLVRAIDYAQDRSFCESVIHSSFKGLVTPVGQGGLMSCRKRLAFFEEILSSPQSTILDGAIYSLFGAIDYYYFLGVPPFAEPSICLLVKSIAKSLRVFDLGFWSRADVMPRKMRMPSSPYYHHVHISQLKALYHLTRLPAFSEYARKWQNYDSSVYCRAKALLYKLIFKLAYY